MRYRPGGLACVGRTGDIARIDGYGVHRLVRGLSSVASRDGSFAGGPSDLAWGGNANPLVLVQDTGIDASGANPFGSKGNDLGKLVVGLKGGQGGSLPTSDFARLEALHNPDQGAGVDPSSGDSVIDSDPYGITAYRGGYAVVDAAGNDLLFVDKRGVISALAVFPIKVVPAPPIFGAPPGTKVPVQPVPTSVRVGPDGALYVSELSIVPGTAQVWRVVPGHKPTVYGPKYTSPHGAFTAISDIAFDWKGRLLVLEIARDSIIAPPSPGVLLRLEHNGSVTTLASAGLNSPTGLTATGHDIYISNNGTSPASGHPSGQVVRLYEVG